MPGLIKAIDGIGRGFDYGALPSATAGATKAATDRIRRRVAGQIKSIIETGDDLLHVKELLEHGQFTAWLTAEFGMTDRTARNYMAAASAFKGKSETISVLPAATVYALASAPEETRNIVVGRLEAGERPDEGSIRDLLLDAAYERKKAATEAKKSPEQRSREKTRQRRRDADRERENKQHEDKAAAQSLATERAVRLIFDAFGGRVDDLIQLLDDGEYHNLIVRRLRALRGDFPWQAP